MELSRTDLEQLEKWERSVNIANMKVPLKHAELTQLVRELELENARLREANRDLMIALTDVMVWVDGWEPEFVDDPEWAETDAIVRRALLATDVAKV